MLHLAIIIVIALVAIVLLSQTASAYGKATIPVGEDPKDVGVNPKTNMVYVANFDNVAVIDGSTNAVVSKIPIGNVNGWAIEVNPNSGKVYVAGHLSSSILVLDASTNTVATTIHLSDRPTGVAINPETNMIYAASADVMEISVIDGSSDTLVTAIDLRPNHENNGLTAIWPSGIAVDVEKNLVYEGGSASSAIVVIDGATNKIIERIERDGDFRRMAMDPSSGLVYAGNVQYGTVDVIGNMPVDSFRKSDGTPMNYPQAIDVNPETGRIYVSDSDSVLVIGSDNGRHALLEKVEVGGIPMGIAVNPETNMIYVANYIGNSISVIDGKTSKVILMPWSVWPEIVTYSAIGGTAALILFNRLNRFQRTK